MASRDGVFSKKYISECVTYDTDSGVLLWRYDRPSSHFNNKGSYVSWLNGCGGKIAGSVCYKRGKAESIVIRIKDFRFKIHNVIWVYLYGVIPEGHLIDHIDGDPTNNKLSNLRCVTHSINQRNRKRNKNNTSGVNGVHKIDGGWRVYGKKGGKSVHIATCTTLEQARDLRIAWENTEGGYTSLHGTDFNFITEEY